MTIDQAIKSNTALINLNVNGLTGIEKRGIKLGIEALKRTRERRDRLRSTFEPLLPGETTE